MRKCRDKRLLNLLILPVNPAYKDSKEDAPVDIGGQTPIEKRNALDDLNLAAECVYHFAKTGELSPALKWEKAPWLE